MAPSIVGTLPVSQSVDSNGSLALEITLQIPPAKMAPKLLLAYHSASTRSSVVGMGFALKGAPMIERVAATKDQDGFRGVINYDENDRFSLDGQRLVHISGNEYRYELEQWSKITAHGDPKNPTAWTEYLTDGGIRKFGDTQEPFGQTATRVWAISEQSDAYSNYMSFKYMDGGQGSFYLSEISYGGNRKLTPSMTHQRQLKLEYELRPDVTARYMGGSLVRVDKRLKSVSASVSAALVHQHLIEYDSAPLTRVSRAVKLTLVDASGAAVRPLVFDWVDGTPAMFEVPQTAPALEFLGADASMLSMDVHATGRSDVVIASKVTVSSTPRTRIATHLSDASGAISASASFINSELPYHTALFPLDVSGDGRTDLVHISLAGPRFKITVLLSTVDGFKIQPESLFEPRSTTGFFRCGDFEGNGRVGLVYLYKAASDLKFVQFISDDKRFTPKAIADGPKNIAFDDLKVVVGDLNGNGEEDVFLLSPKTKDSRRYCHISLLRSNDGTLQYQPDDSLVQAGESIAWTDTTTFLPYSVDDDGKTSLLVASKKTPSGNLTLQLLRNNGRTLLPSPPARETDIRYDGNLTTAHTSSITSVDLINTFHMRSANRTAVNVLRFHDGAFEPVDGVRQGPSFNSVTWGDFRGIGRSDMFFNTAVAGKFNISPMRCASSQPVDFLSGYRNGMDARIDVTYAPLSDRTTYNTDPDVPNAPMAALNAMARNVSSTANLSTSSVFESNHSRSQIVYFPAWVVKDVIGTPYAAKPALREHTNYGYRNARFSFGGRGWLGFEAITKSALVLGTSETTYYLQSFPFLGQVDRTETKTTSGQLLLSRKYIWADVPPAAGHGRAIRMSSLSQESYEGGTRAYTVNARYGYDAFNNITELSIVSPESGAPALSIVSLFENSISGVWVIGNKTRETVKQGDAILKDAQIRYKPGTQSAIETKNWVKGSEWSTQTVEFDAAGNETVIHGPARAHHVLEYDATHSHVATSRVFPADNAAPLIETTEISLQHGKPLRFTDPNGNTLSFTYDVLGRLHETFQENVDSGKTLVKTEAFLFADGQFQHVMKSRTTWGKDEWFTHVEYIDGLQQIWRTERSRPDNSSGLICNDSEYDAAGRTIRSSRDYLSGSSPAFTTYRYDARSRIVEEVVPPSASGLPATTISSLYKFAAGLEECTETSSAGSISKILLRKTQYLPNADKPSVDTLVNPFVLASIDELGQNVTTSFDGLGRPTCVKDPGGVQLALAWDGLSRLVERRLSDAAGKDLNHSVLAYDDSTSTTTVRNVLTGTLTATTYDFCKRPVSMTSADEKKLTYTYDVGATFSRGRLMSVASESTGLVHRYDYDVRGHLVLGEVTVDGEHYPTTYEWSPLGQLTSITNPDGSTIARSFLADGESVSQVVLSTAADTLTATVNLSRYDVFGRPLLCEFGNGISSTSAVHANGALSSIALANGTQTLHRQDWKINESDWIHDYKRDRRGDLTGSLNFVYDASGQLTRATSDASTAEYAYDPCGNLTAKDGQTFVNASWQLSRITNRDGSTECSFEYSVDGNMVTKLDGSSKTSLRSMEYDSQGRLIRVDGTRMVYDFGGRLIKCTRENGDVTVYPTQTYEVDIVAASGTKTHTAYLMHGYRRASLSGSAVRYYHQDHLGSTIAVSDARGQIVTEYKYDAFGKVSVVGEDLARYKFSGKELFGDIYYFGARFYDPAASLLPEINADRTLTSYNTLQIGRFLTLDNYPLDLDGISPCTFNMYTFARNNSVNFIDLNGNAPWWHWLVDAALVAVGVALLFVPVVGPMATIAMGAVTGALIGGGIAGFTADIGGASDAEWGIQIGIGAAIGAVTGGAAARVDLALPAINFTTKNIGSAAARTAVRFATKFAIEKGAGVVQQLVDNAIHGRAAEEALLPASINFLKTGEVDWKATGFDIGSKVVGFAGGKYVARHTGSYDVKHASRKFGKAHSQRAPPKVDTGAVNHKAPYPLNQTGLDVSASGGPVPRLRSITTEAYQITKF